MVYEYGKNKKLQGIIKNQDHTINGLVGEIKNLSYHLGKIKKR